MYTVYFAGGIQPGHDENAVKAAFAKIFKADTQKLSALFSGAEVVIKRDVDKATAEKYEAAIDSAGGVAIIRPPLLDAPLEAEPEPTTMAERLASIVGDEPNDPQQGQESAPIKEVDKPLEYTTGEDMEESEAAQTDETHEQPVEDNLEEPVQAFPNASSEPETLETIDFDAVSSNEEATEVQADISEEQELPSPGSSNLQGISESLQDLVGDLERMPEEPQRDDLPQEEAQSISDPILGEIGFLGEDENSATDTIELLPVGTHVGAPEGEATAIETVDAPDYSIAPPGSDVLEAQYKPGEPPPPPSTDHIRLED
ncbi:hypothetical protein A3709_20400 [Halioglobus sp. HI00S01]|uniref:hypothetical protein n=1 Tax=Halioglobus sp. HI00S01 TaxID=1822214 RepID=UPI0007C2AAAB|nr:hypothetical protein [Halioglobus sp. HI00S01]KZX57974.1 hypothetical protein A3709_20400 [Halioglobus sp. HI00S01]